MRTDFIYDCTHRFVHFAYHFTAQERDQETGNDFFQARYYASGMGRFMSPDPSGLEYADQSNPQSLNLYSYSLSNPLRYVDPTGLHYECTTVTITPADPDGNSTGTGTTSTQSCTWVDDGMFDGLLRIMLAQQRMQESQTNTAATPAPSSVAPRKPGLFTCASEAANSVSIAGGLHALGIGKSGGFGGFLTSALGGNTLSGITDTVKDIGQNISVGGNGNQVVADIAVGGVSQGLPIGQGSIFKGAGGLAADGIAAGIHAGISAGGELTTLAGTVSTVGLTGAEYAAGVGELKLAYDAITYAGSLLGCAAGVIH